MAAEKFPASHSVVAELHAKLKRRNRGESLHDLIRLVGYFGQGPEPGSKRLHRSLDDLSEYIDVREDDIVHYVSIPVASLGQGTLEGAFYVWTTRDARVTSGRIQPASAQARYLEGEITLANLAQAVRCLVTGDEKSKDLVIKWGETGEPC